MSNQDASDWQQVFRDYITKQGLRVTVQRLAIAEAFFSREGHSNVEELYAAVRAKRPSIGYATVYRTVKLLSECGLAEAHNFGDGATRFEPALGDDHHDHLICNECGHIIEFENEEIERLQLEVARTHGFALQDHKMELYGVCVEFSRGEPCPYQG